jgi:protocatechuate 3,4-dioxygenase beta subunit
MIPVLFALLLAQDKAIFEGTVVNALTGEPLRKAQVLLDEGNRRYAVISGSDGKFRFEGIIPAEYHMETQRQGFLDADDDPWFELEPGDHLKDVVIKMTPQGLIAGHVVDEDGDPVPGLQVHASRTIHVNGRAVVLGTEGGFTNQEGYFLVAELAAGRYYLSAEPLHRYSQEVSQPGHPGREEEFVHTDDPVPFDITVGAALRNVEIHIRKSAVFRIRGRVANPPKESAGIRLAPPEGVMRGNDPQANLRDGSFEFAGIEPGSHLLMCDSPGLYCRVPVSVVDHNVDISVDLAPGPNIEGTIKMEGGGSFPQPPVVQLVDKMVVAKEDGTFGWTNLAPRKYVVDYGPPDGCYVKSIQFNHQPLTGIVLDLSSGVGGTLDIVVAPNASAISVTVEGGKQAEVTLWNDSHAYYMDTDAKGVIHFDHLAPGEYRILAWQKMEHQFVEIPEFRAHFDATKITLAEGANENATVKLIPKSASDAEVAKLQ